MRAHKSAAIPGTAQVAAPIEDRMTGGIISSKTTGTQAMVRRALIVAAIIAFAPAAASAAQPVVLVPDSAAPEVCFVTESLAAMLALTPGVRLVRAPLGSTKTLETARLEARADLALSGTRRPGAQPGTWRIEIALARSGPGAASVHQEAAEPSVATLATQLWPRELPPLFASDAYAAASPAALEAACSGDAALAYNLSGAAIGEAVRNRVEPPPEARPSRRERPLLIEWARGEGLLRRGRTAEGLSILRRILARTTTGETAPLWRRPSGEGAPSAPAMHGPAAVWFDRGRFVSRAAQSGRALWTIDAGRADPSLADAGGGLLVAFGDRVIAVEAATGVIPWTLELAAAWPELAVHGTDLLLATPEVLLAIDRRSARESWRVESTAELSAGPVLSGDRVLVPLEGELGIFDAATGRRTGKVRIGDELSAPLFSAAGRTWALIGADRVARIDPGEDGSSATLRAATVTGASWPPLAAGDEILIAARDRRRGTSILRFSGEAEPKVIFRRGVGPLVPLPDGAFALLSDRRDQVIALSIDGKFRWRSKLPGPARALTVAGDTIWVAASDRLLGLDPGRGKPVVEIMLGEAIIEAATGEQGSVVLADGAVIGLPARADPRIAAWQLMLRKRLAEGYLTLGQAARAEELLREILAAHPEDVTAWVLSARAAAKRDPRRATKAWLELSSKLPPDDPLEREVLEALHQSAGVQARLRFDQPIASVATSSDGVTAVQSGARVFALAEDPASPPRWTKPGSTLLALGETFGIDEAWVRATDGSVTTQTRRAPRTLTRAGLVRLEGSALALEDPPGAVQWQKRLELEGPRVLDASPRAIAIEAGGTIHLLAASDGSPLSTYEARMPVRSAALSGELLLVSLERELRGIDVLGGKLRFRVLLAKEERRRLIGQQDGWIVINGAQVWLIDHRGRSRPKITLPSPPLFTRYDAETGLLFASLERGGLIAADLLRGRTRGRIDALAAGALGVARGRLYVADQNASVLWVLDAARALEPLRGRAAADR